MKSPFVGVGTGEVIGLGHLIGSQDSVGAAVSQAVCQGLGFGACADAASPRFVPSRAMLSPGCCGLIEVWNRYGNCCEKL